MSTPRHDCKTDDRKLAIDRPCSACSAGDSEMEYHDHCPPFREGVAAPLEPTPSAKFFMRDNFPETYKRVWHAHLDMLVPEVMRAYAAAVSKNLQEELASEKASVDQLCGDVRAIQRDYMDERKLRVKLEKEITALRTAQTAVTGTESHWRGRDAALRETTK